MIDTQTPGHADDSWQQCPHGLLQEMAPPPPQPQLLGGFSKGVLLGLVMAVVIFGYAMINEDEALPPGNLYCHQVQGYMQDYASKQLNADMHQRVSKHLAACDKCRTAYESLAAQVALPASFAIANLAFLAIAVRRKSWRGIPSF